VSGNYKEGMMKFWQGIIAIMVILAIMPLSSCEYLGLDNRQREYEEQIKIYEEYNKRMKEHRERQQEYQRKVIEAYNKQMTDVYKEYSEGLTDYYEGRQKSIEDAITESDNQTE
jgi:hypothetical protein